jgi:uncharacterized protein YndB with AHSA1/START domain
MMRSHLHVRHCGWRSKPSSAKTVLEVGIGTLRMQEWQLNSMVEVFVDASAERLWAALTEAADTEHYLMCSRVTVGDVGGAYRLEREDGWEVDGTVLAKEPPYRLRVTWRIKTPPDLVMPNCEVEYLIEPVLIPEPKSKTKLTVNSYVDGPVPPPFINAGRTGWAMITRNLKDYLG